MFKDLAQYFTLLAQYLKSKWARVSVGVLLGMEILLGGDTEAETIAEALDLLLRQFGRLLATKRSIGPRCLSLGTKKSERTSTRQAI